MIRIGLISDTHSHLDKKIFDYFEECDEIWHAGDFGSVELIDELASFKPLKGVYGNIDNNKIRAQFPLNLRFEIEGFDVWMTHIGGYPGRYSQRVRNALEKNAPDIFICGHSHILKVVRDKTYKNMLCINPGAAGIVGFHKIKTIIRFTLNNSRIEKMEAIELGKRASLK